MENGDDPILAELDPVFHSLKDLREFALKTFRPNGKKVQVKHVVLDADDTIWTIRPWGLASIATPLGNTQGNILAVSYDAPYTHYRFPEEKEGEEFPPSYHLVLEDVKEVDQPELGLKEGPEGWGERSPHSTLEESQESEEELEPDNYYDEYEGYLEPAIHGRVKLDRTLRPTLDELERRGIPVSIASANDKESILAYLEAFNIRDKFTNIEASLAIPKSQMVEKIARENKIDPESILFVNDSPENCVEVSYNTLATALVKGFSIKRISDLLEFLK